MEKTFRISSLCLAVPVIFAMMSFMPEKRIADVPKIKDTIEYKVFVIADRVGVEYFGGEEMYRKRLDGLFDDVNNYWNNGSDKFKYYFRFVPDLTAVYDGSSKVAENYFRYNVDSTRHDVLLVLDSILDFDDERGGWACGGGPDHLGVVVCRGRSKTGHEDIFDGKGHRGIAHEFGHYRGVTDLYADRISENKNPVNNIGYEPDSCIMNNHHVTDIWSSYAVNIINYTAESKRPGRDFPDFFRKMFPENIFVEVKVKGKRKEGVKLNMYGSRAVHNDLIPAPYRTYVTGNKGLCLITGVPSLYDRPSQPLHTDDLPYNRWFTFLLEAEYDGEKQYVWLPEYEVQNLFFENKDTYNLTIEFK